MKFRTFERYFSEARINRYSYAVGHSKRKAIRLYKANLKVAQAFHPLLGLLEVVLRNRLNEVLTTHFGDPDWIINQKTGFMSDSSLIFTHKRTGRITTNDFLKREISKAEKRLRKTGLGISSGKVLAEQTLGFWTDLFEVHHYRILKGTPIRIFNYLPPGYGRKEIIEDLTRIRRFRNRINHNEPICFKGNKIDFSESTQVYKSILNILTWIDPAFIKFISDIDEVKKTIKISQSI